MRIGLLTGDTLPAFRLATLMPILKDKSFSIEFAVIDDSPEKSITQKIIKNLRKGRGGYMLIMAFQRFFKRKEITINTEEFCKENGISVHKTKDIYSTDTIDIIRKNNPDILLIAGGFGILKEPLLSLTRLGVLSYHHGDMRKYRGQPPAFWELYSNEKEMGITVQILTSGLDCGIPVEEKTLEIKKDDTLKKLQNRATKESENMMYQALKKLSDPDFVPSKIETFGKVYTIPNLRQWITLHVRILRRWVK
jgi:folate-dependent phosphoribosylglycinamide formyltransferase PurN